MTHGNRPLSKNLSCAAGAMQRPTTDLSLPLCIMSRVSSTDGTTTSRSGTIVGITVGRSPMLGPQ